MTELHKLTVRLEADAAPFGDALKTADRNIAAFGARTAQVAAPIAKTATAIQTMGSAATHSIGGFSRLTGQLATTAAATLPVNAGVLRLGAALGGFALSGGTMVAVLGGLSALGALWKRITKDATELAAAARKAGDSIREMWMEQATAGDIRLIDQLQPLQLQRDKLARDIRELEAGPRRRSVTGEFFEDRLKRLQKEYADLDEQVRQGETLLAQRRQERRDEQSAKARREADRRVTDEKRVSLAAAKSAAERLTALTELHALGALNLDQIDELRAAHAKFASIMRDQTASVIEQNEARKEALRIQRAFNAELQRSLAIPQGGKFSPGVKLPESLQPQVVPAAAPTLRQELGLTRAGLDDAIDQIKKLALTSIPLAVAFEVLRGVTDAMRPALEAIKVPLQAFGQLVGAVLNPIVTALAVPLRLLAIVATYVVQALGWLIRGIGKAINFLLPGNPANGLVRFGQSMINSAKDVRAAMNGLNETVADVTASLRNVPLSFNIALARTRIGQGAAPVRAAVARVTLPARATAPAPARATVVVVHGSALTRAADNFVTQGAALARAAGGLVTQGIAMAGATAGLVTQGAALGIQNAALASATRVVVGQGAALIGGMVVQSAALASAAGELVVQGTALARATGGFVAQGAALARGFVTRNSALSRVAGGFVAQSVALARAAGNFITQGVAFARARITVPARPSAPVRVAPVRITPVRVVAPTRPTPPVRATRPAPARATPPPRATRVVVVQPAPPRVALARAAAPVRASPVRAVVVVPGAVVARAAVGALTSAARSFVTQGTAFARVAGAVVGQGAALASAASGFVAQGASLVRGFVTHSTALVRAAGSFIAQGTVFARAAAFVRTAAAVPVEAPRAEAPLLAPTPVRVTEPARVATAPAATSPARATVFVVQDAALANAARDFAAQGASLASAARGLLLPTAELTRAAGGFVAQGMTLGRAAGGLVARGIAFVRTRVTAAPARPVPARVTPVRVTAPVRVTQPARAAVPIRAIRVVVQEKAPARATVLPRAVAAPARPAGVIVVQGAALVQATGAALARAARGFVGHGITLANAARGLVGQNAALARATGIVVGRGAALARATAAVVLQGAAFARAARGLAVPSPAPVPAAAGFAGQGATQVRAAGSVSIGPVYIQASPTGDTPESLWTKFNIAAKRAANGGDPLARSLVMGTP